MTLALLITGVVTLAAQVLLLRELTVAFFGVELVYILGLGVWLFGSGLGAALGPRRAQPGGATLAVLFLLLAALVPGELVFWRGLRQLAGGTPGAYLPLGQGLAALLVGLVPPALVAGQLFAWAARRAVLDGGTFARAYAIESLGSLAGGLAVTLGLALGRPALQLALGCGLVAAGGAFVATRKLRRPVRWVVGLGLVALVPVVAVGPALDRRLTRWSHPALRETRDTPYARVAVAESLGQVSVFVNDALAFESEGVDAETFVQPALLTHVAPRRILILGGAAEGLVWEALGHQPEVLDAVELDGAAFQLIRAALPAAARQALAAKPVRLVDADPRRFLSSAGRYDVILIGAGDPDSGQANRLFTRELFALCAQHLEPGGLLGLRLRSSENLWTPQLTRRMASIHAALRNAFVDVLWLPGAVDVVLASSTPLTRDPALLGRRLGERGLAPRLVSTAYLRYLLTNDRARHIDALLATSRVSANSDGRPVCYTYAALLWLARFFPRLGFAEPGAWLSAVTAPRVWVLCGSGGLVALLLVRRRPLTRRVGLAFVAGLTGMLSEGVLVLHYQTRVGALFRDVGLLLTAFMAGLALGAWALGRAARTPSATRALGGALLVTTVLLHAGLALALERGWGLSGVTIAVLLVLSGLSVGGLLAIASAHGAAPDRAVAPLYAADLAGGCLGAVLGALLLIPWVGLAATALVVSALALGALLLV